MIIYRRGRRKNQLQLARQFTDGVAERVIRTTTISTATRVMFIQFNQTSPTTICKNVHGK